MEAAEGMSGRKAQAARNDKAILAAAREVFIEDPAAPISSVAARAGVGISALYRRYDGKDVLLQTLCAEGLRRYITIVETALAGSDPWESFASFLADLIEADVHSLTVHLAGTFDSTSELRELATATGTLTTRLLRRAKAAGVVRRDLQVNDLPMILEQVGAVRLGDSRRTNALRRRYLALQLAALRVDPAGANAPEALPGSAPTNQEYRQRWIRR